MELFRNENWLWLINPKFLTKWIISLKMEKQSSNRYIHYYHYFSTDEETEEQRETYSDFYS